MRPGRPFGRRPRSFSVDKARAPDSPGARAWIRLMTAVLAANDRVVEYLPVLILLLFAVGFAALNLVLSWLAGSKGQHNPVKDAAYECGLPPITDAHAQFSVKFYLVALLFVLFDIEVVFLYPWATSLGSPGLGTFALVQMLIFIGLVFLAYIYEWRRGGLEWD